MVHSQQHLDSLIKQAGDQSGSTLDYALTTQSPVERLSNAIESASRLVDEFDGVTVGLVGYANEAQSKDPNVAEVPPASEFERITYLARELEKINARTADNMNRIRSAMSTVKG